MAVMMDQQLPEKNSNAWRNNPQKEGNQREKGTINQNPTAGHMVSQETWITAVERVTTNTRATRVMQRLTTAWADQIAPVDTAETTAHLDPQTEAEERQCLV